MIIYLLDLSNPIISKSPSGPVVRYTNVVLTCQFKGYPSPKITWYHGSSKLKQQNSTQYIIHNATYSDEGDYTCSISNKVSTKITSPVTVILNCKLLICNIPKLAIRIK